MMRSSSGNVLVMVLSAIAMAGVLSYTLFQMTSGPLLTVMKISKTTTAEAQMQSVGRMTIVAANNQASSGDCDGDRVIEPPEWRTTAGVKPTNGGLMPLTIGSTVTDPWGTDYGYCVWDMGTLIDDAACGGAAQKRLAGSPTPDEGNASTRTVLAFIAAGPDKQFQTTCNDYSNATTDVITTSGDDVVLRYTYADAARVASTLWSIKTTDADTAVINKDLTVGDGSSSGGISALSMTTTGKVIATGGLQAGDETTVLVCDNTAKGLLRYNDSIDKMQYCDGASWVNAAGAAQFDDLIDGKTDYTVGHNFFLGLDAGTPIDAGVYNTGIGYQALKAVDDGSGNTAMGYQSLLAAGIAVGSSINTAAGSQALLTLTTAEGNVAAGYQALKGLNVVGYNVAVGSGAAALTGGALRSVAVGFAAMAAASDGVTDSVAVGANAMAPFDKERSVAIGAAALSSTGSNDSVAIGYAAMETNEDGAGNVAIGGYAMQGDGDGFTSSYNTAIGFRALYLITDNAGYNTAMGAESMAGTTTGAYNSALGYQSLYSNSTGSYNSVFGYQAAFRNTTGTYNTAMGYQALYANETGGQNTALGYLALSGSGGDNNTAAGAYALSESQNMVAQGTSENTALGASALYTIKNGSANTAVGYMALYSGAAPAGNTAIGAEALYTSEGNYNVSIGYRTLYGATTGSNNVAIGSVALGSLKDMDGTVAVGYSALVSLSGGNNNTAVGSSAMSGSDGFSENTAIGYSALQGSGSGNTAVGYQALITGGDGNVGVGVRAFASVSVAAANTGNTAVGYQAATMIESAKNTAIGSLALYGGTNCNENTAIGSEALYTSYGVRSVAVGHKALFSTNTTCTTNTAVGYKALYLNEQGYSNTAVGAEALAWNNRGHDNTAVGNFALHNNTIGKYNTAFGYGALQSNVEAGDNSALGSGALAANTSGEQNTAVGAEALSQNTVGGNNTAIGYEALKTNRTGGGATAVGYKADVIGNLDNVTVIGANASVSAPNYVRIGDTSITTIAGVVGWTNLSDRRVKKDITDSDLGLDFIRRLQPVSYRLKEGNQRLDYGFIAQDIEQALDGRVTNMVVRDNDKMKTYQLRSNDLIAPAVSAAQELSRNNTAERAVLGPAVILTQGVRIIGCLALSFFLGLAAGAVWRRPVKRGIT